MAYLLDANVFIQGKNLHYGLDFCPAFWDWLIAVITHEVPSPTVRKIKIPDACIGLGVKVMTPYEMLRRERARFVLAARP